MLLRLLLWFHVIYQTILSNRIFLTWKPSTMPFSTWKFGKYLRSCMQKLYNFMCTKLKQKKNNKSKGKEVAWLREHLDSKRKCVCLFLKAVCMVTWFGLVWCVCHTFLLHLQFPIIRLFYIYYNCLLWYSWQSQTHQCSTTKYKHSWPMSVLIRSTVCAQQNKLC